MTASAIAARDEQLETDRRIEADFADAMCGRFAGSEVMRSTVTVYCHLTNTTDSPNAAVQWLYEYKPVETLRAIQQRRRCNAI